jgi:hypothetical protein
VIAPSAKDLNHSHHITSSLYALYQHSQQPSENKQSKYLETYMLFDEYPTQLPCQTPLKIPKHHPSQQRQNILEWNKQNHNDKVLKINLSKE